MNTFFKKILSVLLILLSYAPVANTFHAMPPHPHGKHSRHHTSPGFSTHRNTVYIPKRATQPSPPDLAVKFFPMIAKPRKFFIKDSMIKKLTSSCCDTTLTVSDFNERADIIALEVIRILDIGDPEKLTIKKTPDFDEIYKRYIELSQKLASLDIKNIPRPTREAIESLGICYKAIPLTEMESIHSKVNPLDILRIGEWYRIPIEIELDEKQEFDPHQVAAWYTASRYAQIISTQCRGIGFLLQCMHNLFALLPEIFPEIGPS